jgi:hypothetical protein
MASVPDKNQMQASKSVTQSLQKEYRTTLFLLFCCFCYAIVDKGLSIIPRQVRGTENSNH